MQFMPGVKYFRLSFLYRYLFDLYNMDMPFISFQNVTKVYHQGEVDIHALSGVDFDVEKGQIVIVAGASGAGKSTVLNILGGMDSPTTGEITVDGVRIDSMSEKELTEYRRNDIGFVFQFYNLVQNLTARENVDLATEICIDPLDSTETLRQVGLGERLNNFPAQLSGGEQQRVSIARALAKNPKILLCDEPTGALDYQTGKAILKLLQDTCRQSGRTVIVITHNSAICAMADRIIRLKNGRIESAEINENPVDVETINW